MNRTLLPIWVALGVLSAGSTVKAQFHDPSTGRGNASARQMHNPYSRQAVPRQGYTGGRYGGGNSMTNSSVKTNSVNAVLILPTIAENAAVSASENPHLQGAEDITDQYNKIRAQGKDVRRIGMAVDIMEFKDADVWGRAKNHPNGTYTETIFDSGNNNALEQGLSLVIQRTRRPSKTQMEDHTVMTRKIYVDQWNKPLKVDILDGSDSLKFKGNFVYDNMGRLTEEQIYNHSGALIRRKVYPYNELGEPQPPRNWDYCHCGRSKIGSNKKASGCTSCVATAGKDLVALVEIPHDQELLDDKINRLKQDIDKKVQGKKQRSRLGQGPGNQPPAKPFFRLKTNSSQQTASTSSSASTRPNTYQAAAPSAAATAAPAKPLQKPRGLRGFFGRKK